MAITGKQSPFGAGLNGSLLQDIGLCINPVTAGYVGTSHTIPEYTAGSLVKDTCLYWASKAMNNAYNRLVETKINSTTYSAVINMGQNTSPAMGNSKPPTYTWIGPANSGDPTSLSAQSKSWYPFTASSTTNVYPTTNPTPRQYSNLTETHYDPDITQWGWIRLFALQAWNEFNWNGYPAGDSGHFPAPHVYYKEFLASFNAIAGFIDYNNVAINSQTDGSTFLKNTYSNVDDLMSADITGISKATPAFGQDLIKTGKAIDLTKIATFGMPSNLLLTLQRYNTITSSLTYAILSSGIAVNELDKILTGAEIPTKLQEQKLYGAFCIITGSDLDAILVPLNCSVKGLNSLADLLNPMKLFPDSYASLTVPVYNSGPGPTNAKTYYPIYIGSGINQQLTSPAVKKAVGAIGVAPVSVSAPDLGTNFQIEPSGFGTYVQGIIPDDIATACGAFSVAVRQVRNVQTIPIEKFAQVVANMETTKGLPLAAGTNIPTNSTLSTGGLNQTALGSGPNGSWVMSDFLGCMSGLPYAWKDIKTDVKTLETRKLINIYQELCLATGWKQATVSVQYSTYQVETSPGVFTTYYKITGATVVDGGGGYGRGGASTPIITVNGGSGASITCVMGTDPNDWSTYGKVKSVTVTSTGADTTTIPTATVNCPPTATLPILSNGSKSSEGQNTPAGTNPWPATMSQVIQDYTIQAEDEIKATCNKNPTVTEKLNKNWNLTGKQLTIEQRARDMALQPVPTPKDNRLNPYPVAVTAYTDALPTYSQKTEPHMYAQTISAITDMNTPGGQAQEAQQRAERNQKRLMDAGIPLDDNMAGNLNPLTTKILLANGTVSIAKQGISAGPAIFTIPANPEVVNAAPQGYYDPSNDSYMKAPMISVPLLNSIPEIAMPGQDRAGPDIEQVKDPITPIAYAAPSGPATPLPIGLAYPGSLARSPYINLIPPNLSIPFISGILPSSTYTVSEAIDEVVRCNCDCWLE